MTSATYIVLIIILLITVVYIQQKNKARLVTSSNSLITDEVSPNMLENTPIWSTAIRAYRTLNNGLKDTGPTYSTITSRLMCAITLSATNLTYRYVFRETGLYVCFLGGAASVIIMSADTNERWQGRELVNLNSLNNSGRIDFDGGSSPVSVVGTWERNIVNPIFKVYKLI